MALGLALIIILGLAADYLFRRMQLPGLVGMLLAGVLAGPYVLGLFSEEMMTCSSSSFSRGSWACTEKVPSI